MRIGGLASGIDTDSLIRDMMQAHRIPLNKITQKKQFMEWQLNDYREVNRDVRSMRDDLFEMTKQSTYMAKTVSVSNEDAVSIRALNANSEFSGTLQVHQLASAATWQSAGNIAGEPKITDKTAISDVFGGNEITITAPDGESKTITFAEGTDVKAAISQINKEAGVNAFFDEHTGKIAMTAKDTGAGNIEIKVADEVIGVGEAGQNAKFTFNGLETERTSNTFDINGFEITLKEVTAAIGEGETAESVKGVGVVTFSSAPDVDKVFDSVKQFVDDYNELIEKLNGKVKEPLHRTFHPLSDEEKAEMKEKEIEQWEEKAMSGTLRNDPTIQSLLQNMRMTLNGGSGPEGDKNYLSELGITTSKDYLANGKLEIDEDKLRAVIAEDPNKVYETLGKSGEGGEAGLVHQLRDTMKNANDTISRRAGSAGAANESFTLGRNIKEMDGQIERFEDRMQKIEERYWREFTAMEQAMSRAQAQADQMMNMLGGGGMMM